MIASLLNIDDLRHEDRAANELAIAAEAQAASKTTKMLNKISRDHARPHQYRQEVRIGEHDALTFGG